MKFILSLVFFLVLGILIFVLQFFGFSFLVHKKIWFIFVFFLALGFLNFQLMKFAFQNNREKFIIFFMTSMVARLVFSLIFLGTFIFIKIEKPDLFALNFFALYLSVIIFEIFENSRNLRQN